MKSSFSEVVDNAKGINIYQNGEMKSLSYESEDFNNIITEIKQLFDNTREMPAFSVALNDETINSLKLGVWIELEFKNVCTHNEMNFEKLLIEVGKDYSGFNVIRYNNYKYEGRCFYFDIINYDMSGLYEKILKLNDLIL